MPSPSADPKLKAVKPGAKKAQPSEPTPPRPSKISEKNWRKSSPIPQIMAELAVLVSW